MATHDINISLPSFELDSRDLTVIVHRDGEKLGTITISKGSIDYKPAYQQVAVKIDWARFNSIMTELWEDEYA